MIRKIVVSIVIFPLLILPLFCCCIKQAQAAVPQVAPCHNSQATDVVTKNDHSKAKHSHSCDCPQSLGSVADNVSTANVAFLSFQKFFPSLDFQETRITNLSRTSIHLAYLGPPIGVSAVVPLYIKYHSLRI